MSFFLDTVSPLAPSDTAEASSASCTKKKGKKSAPVLGHTRQPLEGEDTTLLYCAHCPLGDKEKLPYGSDTSSAMTKHIQRKHPTVIIEKPLSKKQEVVKQQLRQLYIQDKSNGDIDEFHLEVLEACLNDEVVLEALITLIVVRNLSYNLVEWAEFHTLCQALNKACEGRIPTSHSTVHIKTKEAWKKHKHTIRIKLQVALSYIHISLDIWTSLNRYLLLAICAHFTTYEGKKENALLALKEVLAIVAKISSRSFSLSYKTTVSYTSLELS
jgi:hypothetical protein